MNDSALSEADWQRLHADLDHLAQTLARVIVGQDALIGDLITALFAGGHILLEGLPGLGKTHLAKALAGAVGLPLARIQCTPDLMPADITGSEILLRDDHGRQRLDFRPGPLFAPIVLVDEINRATPKTQAAFLEAMQERQVTYAGTRYPLPAPFWVLATQNPIELEGTYPLPEAQLDRFLAKLTVPYPDAGALLALLDVSLDDEPAAQVAAVLDPARLQAMLAQIREVYIGLPVRQAAVDLILATQPERVSGPARSHLRYGASPRGLQSLLRAARVKAAQAGRVHVAYDDLQAVALPVLRHRVLLNMSSELDGVTPDRVIGAIVATWSQQHH